MNKTTCTVAALLAALVLTTLSGCLRVRTSEPPLRRQYAIQIPPPATKLAPANKTLRVRTFRMASPFRGRELVYRTGDASYETDFYNILLADPGSLVTDQVRQWIGSTSLFRNVVPDFSRVDADTTLEGQILQLYGDYRDRNKPAAVVQVQFFLLRPTENGHEILFEKTYVATVPIQKRDPALLVAAFGQGLHTILQSLSADLADKLRTTHTP